MAYKNGKLKDHPTKPTSKKKKETTFRPKPLRTKT